MTNLTKPAHITSLATSAILINIDVRVWTATKQDKQSSEEFTNTKKADREAASVTQHLLANNIHHKAALNYRQTIYNWKERRTYPWAGGMEILPVSDYPQFMKEFTEHQAKFNEIVDKFMQEYPGIVANMAFKMGDMFNRSFYPSVHEVAKKFSVDLYTSEVPEGDFRVQISQELADDLHNNYERQANRLIDEILSKQAGQLVSVMESISHTCDIETITASDGTQKVKRRKLYDSTIQRALELCDSFKGFNLTADPKLEAARGRLDSTLRGINLDALRESDHMRVAVKNEVDDILAKFRV
jgi:hypothetical protein